MVPIISLIAASVLGSTFSSGAASATTQVECEPWLAALELEDVPFDTLLEDLTRDPIGTYRRLETQSADAPDGNYLFVQRRPAIMKLIADLNARLAPGSVLEKEQFATTRARLRELRRHALEIFAGGVPARELYRLTLDYIETMDALFRSTDPRLKGTYHRDFGESLFRSFEPAGRGTHVFFTNASVSDEDLWQIRPTATYLQWLIDVPPFLTDAAHYDGGPLVDFKAVRRYLDGLMLDLEEIAKHDLGHSWYMKRQDEWLFETAGLSRVALVTEWTKNKDRLVGAWTALKERDFELSEAARFLIAEVVHERGYQFYLPILKQQFDAEKWASILAFKQKNRYWGRFGITDAQVARLDDARRWLVATVEGLLVEENLERIKSLDAERTMVTLKVWRPIESHVGVPRTLEHHAPHETRVIFEVPGRGLITTSLYEISLVLGQPSPQLLTPANHPYYDGITKLERYKLERLLTYREKGQSTAFTVTHPPEAFHGRVIAVDESRRILTFLDHVGRTHEFDLTRVSLQPGPRDLIGLNHKYINSNADDRFVDEAMLHDAYEKYKESLNARGPSFVVVRNPQSGEEFELGMVDTGNPVMARAVSSILTRSLEDAKFTKGGYLPPQIVKRVQTELVSPFAVNQLWGRMGRRFVLSRAAGPGRREIMGSVLVGESRDNIFFFTSRFNNLKHSRLASDIDFNLSTDGDPDHRWFDKFALPPIDRYKPAGYHHFANFVIEREGSRGQGLARFLIESIIRNYSRDYLNATGAPVRHSQRLLCGRGFWQIGDPPWLARMDRLNFTLRLGAESFHIDQPWDPLAPTMDGAGNVRDHVGYNASFGLPQTYQDYLANPTPPDLAEDHLIERIPDVIELARGGRAKLQYYQLMFPFSRVWERDPPRP